MDEYKHYIRTDANGLVIHGFTDAFEPPIAGDLLLSGYDGRHFHIPLTNGKGQYIYKVVSGQMVARTQTELDTEWNTKPPSPPSIENRVKATEDAIKALMGI